MATTDAPDDDEDDKQPPIYKTRVRAKAKAAANKKYKGR